MAFTVNEANKCYQARLPLDWKNNEAIKGIQSFEDRRELERRIDQNGRLRGTCYLGHPKLAVEAERRDVIDAVAAIRAGPYYLSLPEPRRDDFLHQIHDRVAAVDHDSWWTWGLTPVAGGAGIGAVVGFFNSVIRGSFLLPFGIGIGLGLLAATGYVAYCYWEHNRTMHPYDQNTPAKKDPTTFLFRDFSPENPYAAILASILSPLWA